MTEEKKSSSAKATEDKAKQVEKSQPVTKSSKAEQTDGVKKDAVVSTGKQPARQGVQQKKKVFKGRSRGGFRSKTDRPKEEFEQRIIDIARVTRVMAGGNGQGQGCYYCCY